MLRRHKSRARQWVLAGVVLMLVGAVGYVAIYALFAGDKTTEQPQATSSREVSFSGNGEGQDEAPVTADALARYAVDARHPRVLYIDTLSVAARVLPMSVNTNGSIQAPLNIYDTGWYTGGVKPDETGAVFIDGHASGPTREGVFAYLDTLKKGDTLQVEMGDKRRLNYRVVHTEVVPLTNVDMRKALLPYGTASKGLNIMTCTGDWLPAQNTFDRRVVVYTEQI